MTGLAVFITEGGDPPGLEFFAALPDRQRAVVMLRDVDGLRSDEVCQVLDLSPANERVLRNFTLDPRDPKRLTASVPAGFSRVASNRSWVVYARCPSG